MLFITNRTPRQSAETRLNRRIEFLAKNNSVAQSVYYCLRHGVDEYTEIGSAAFLERLRDDECQQLLFYVHGFSNLPEPHIFPRAGRLQQMLDAAQPDLVRVVPMIWPCDADIGIVKDYWDDQKSADQSAFSFARVLERFMRWRTETEDTPCLKRINVLAHSMGNRVLRETVRAWDKYDLAKGVPRLFRNTFLVAADIVNESLELGQPGELLAHASTNVVVYHASDDLALRSSKVSNLRNRVASRRLGHSGPEDIDAVPKNVFAVDCDDFNNDYDTPTGHTYFMDDGEGQPGRVFEHILATLQRGRVFPQEEHRRTLIL